MESTMVQVLLTELETARQSLDRAFASLNPIPQLALHDKPTPVESTPRTPTIMVVTENGFTIERLCETEEPATTDSASGCHFVVRGPNDEEQLVIVAFGEAAIGLVKTIQGSNSLSRSSPFWLCFAERHLAEYLWENNHYPPGGLLTIDQLSENLHLAIRSN